MLFERFISKERNEPPDIDVDFEHQRREEVIQYLYRKYGRERAALTATVITYRPRSALRDVGKALGLDLQQLDRISQSLAWWDGGKALAQRLSESGFNPHSRPISNLLALTTTLLGFPRHLSQHTGGFVIARGKLSRLVPIENAAMLERNVIEWDKDDIDALGILPFVISMSEGMTNPERRKMIYTALLTATIVGLVFLFFGQLILRIMNISVGAFAIAGGLILLVLSIKYVSTGRMVEATKDEMVAVVPIGTPLVVGPAVLTTLLLLTPEYGIPTVLIAFVLNLIISWVVFSQANNIARIMREPGLRAVSQIASLLLGVIAVMMVRKGLVELFTGMK